jgi:hypothetical protein
MAKRVPRTIPACFKILPFVFTGFLKRVKLFLELNPKAGHCQNLSRCFSPKKAQDGFILKAL